MTGMGSPKADLLVPSLATYGTANQLAVAAQPPGSVIAGDSFGVVVAAEDPQGGVDPGFNGTVTIALGANPGHSTLGGTQTVTAYHGIAVFDGLTLDRAGQRLHPADHVKLPHDHDQLVQCDIRPDALAGHILPGSDRCQPARSDRESR